MSGCLAGRQHGQGFTLSPCLAAVAVTLNSLCVAQQGYTKYNRGRKNTICQSSGPAIWSATCGRLSGGSGGGGGVGLRSLGWLNRDSRDRSVYQTNEASSTYLMIQRQCTVHVGTGVHSISPPQKCGERVPNEGRAHTERDSPYLMPRRAAW